MLAEKGGKVMLKRDCKLCLMVFLFALFSCESRKNEESLILKLDSISNSSECIIVRQMALDTLFSWSRSHLKSAPGNINSYGKSWKLDRTVAINDIKNKVVLAVLYSNNDMHQATMDAISFFYGVKITNKWYYFFGPIIHLPRKYYQKDIHTPLSFEILHQIAMKEVFSGYLKKKNKGLWYNLTHEPEYGIDDLFFISRFEGLGWGNWKNPEVKDIELNGGPFLTEKEYYEFKYLRKAYYNWYR